MHEDVYRTFYGVVDATISGPGFCISGSNGKRTIVPDVSYLRKSTETSVTESTDTTGVIISREYEIKAPMDGVLDKKIVCYVTSSALNTVSANTSDTYRIDVSLIVNGDTIVTESGSTHTPNSTSEVTFSDIIVLDSPLREIRRGDKISIKFDVNVIGVDATNPGIEVTLHCDPSVDDDALIVYFM